MQLCENVVRHRLTLSLRAGRAWRRLKQRCWAAALAPLVLAGELMKWALVALRCVVAAPRPGSLILSICCCFYVSCSAYNRGAVCLAVPTASPLLPLLQVVDIGPNSRGCARRQQPAVATAA